MITAAPVEELGRFSLGGEPDRQAVVTAAQELERWCSERDWRGPDPYDGLNASVIARLLRRSPLARRLLTQLVKRSPLDLRPVLRIRQDVSAVALALAISAYARNGFLPEEQALQKLGRCVERPNHERHLVARHAFFLCDPLCSLRLHERQTALDRRPHCAFHRRITSPQ